MRERESFAIRTLQLAIRAFRFAGIIGSQPSSETAEMAIFPWFLEEKKCIMNRF